MTESVSTIDPIHPIRPIGARLLVRPVATPPDPSQLVQTIDEPPIVQADVLRVGYPPCDACGTPIHPHLRSGMRVLLRPAALVQELAYAGETLWMVKLDDVVGELEPADV
jgi:co-chaperonin GroES (HSP10)